MDLISRQAAKKALEDRFMELQKRHSANKYETNFCLNTILELPSINPQAPKWIPIDERLPEKNGWYQCSVDLLGNSEVVMDLFYKDGKWLDSRRMLLDDFDWTRDVKAWMPLPEPYNVDKA